MKDVLSYYDFTGENIDGEYIEYHSGPLTDKEAKDFAKFCLEVEDGGHIDAWYAETGEFAFDVEI